MSGSNYFNAYGSGGAGRGQSDDNGLAYGSNGGGTYGERVPGARRQKVLGYIRAANELRQSYQSTLSQRYLQGDDADNTPPGGFPDADIVRSGDEEMLLFPSYARKHVKKTAEERAREAAAAAQSYGASIQYDNSGDADYWKREWEKLEDENAIVDVDVRGWIYSPQKGPMTRRNRLLVAVARRLSGIPAPDQSSDDSQAMGQNTSWRGRLQDSMMSQEEEAAAREAEIIARRGQKEADAAWKGSYSTNPKRSNTSFNSRSTSPSGASIRTTTTTGGDDESASRAYTATSQSDMSREELLRANEQLMSRLRPFMTYPLANAPITVFFFNESKSQSKSITTDDSGHFNLRAALDFVPTKVRVLASEKLSAVEDVIITDAQGISLVSDIDDTIKHSAIASGAKEIFKNTFIKDLGDLTIEGVKEWYAKMASMGIKLHYVSNSPWQLFPLLTNYFSLAGLPPGSFHLKQYSGMLQGIFEPAAERKRGSLERIMHDFPERKFILVGDSGEADLEVYTDVVLANPGRVLGVFIRDVTTVAKKQFFEQASSSSQHHDSSADHPSQRPNLPARPQTTSEFQHTQQGDLIDFGDEPEPSDLKHSQSSYLDDMQQLRLDGNNSSQPPHKPTKPSNLRSFTTSSQQPSHERAGSPSISGPEGRRPPPPPPKPRRASKSVDLSSLSDSPPSRAPFSSEQQNQRPSSRPAVPLRTPSSRTQSSTYSTFSAREDESYAASTRRQLVNAYNALPQIRSQSPGGDSSTYRGLSSYPAAAARWVTGATGGDPAAGGDGGAPGSPYNKKEEMWKRRWARAEDVMKQHGVLLRSWRVGSDVMEECIKLIEKAQKQKPTER